MTHDEIMNHFKTEFPNEVSDSMKYLEMAKAAEYMGKSELARGLYRMAKDEYTHAKFIAGMIMKSGGTIPADQMSKWNELEEHIFRAFRR